ncbi:OmpA family protein [Aquimarina sp. AU119]|uniref:OmpA family protein n=1 Tax=Aquimarina sp. AU119 TaxID=2108528 RepID=UPI000D68E904|nr:OmpA family protein [Aquimarina sp. AU119]
MKGLFSFLFFLLFAWLGIWWYYSCDWCAKDLDKDTVIVKDEIDSEADALAKKAYEDSIANLNNSQVGLFAKDNKNQEVFRYYENFRINNGNGNVHIPSTLEGFDSQVANYLGKHQDQELVITGLENSIDIEDTSKLGISRANFIKDILVSAGVNANRIVIKTELKEYTYNDDGTYNGGILLNFGDLDTSRLEEVEKSIANRTLYSSFAQKTFQPDATLSNYALELKSYLEKYPNKTVSIIGHTDNVGEKEANLWFGQQRANNVRDYLISQGISKEKIKASSQGESNPIAANDSEENKAKNRRIEITVN